MLYTMAASGKTIHKNDGKKNNQKSILKMARV